MRQTGQQDFVSFKRVKAALTLLVCSLFALSTKRTRLDDSQRHSLTSRRLSMESIEAPATMSGERKFECVDEFKGTIISTIDGISNQSINQSIDRSICEIFRM